MRYGGTADSELQKECNITSRLFTGGHWQVYPTAEHRAQTMAGTVPLAAPMPTAGDLRTDAVVEALPCQ